jgi:cytochrome P450
MESTNSSTPIAPPLLAGKPLVGSAFDLTRDRLGFLRRMAGLGGVASFRMFHLHIIHLSEPEAIQHVLVDNARNYIKGPLFDPMRSLVGNGLFLSDGDFWLRQRRLMQPAFHQRRLAALVEGMADETQAALNRWAELAGAGQAVDIAAETTALAMRVVTRALFSSAVTGGEKRLAEAITTIIDEITFRFDNPFYPPLSFPTPRNRHTRAAVRAVDEEVYAILNQRRGNGVVKDDLLAMLMEARDELDGKGMTDQQLRDEVLIMFAAGHETTANAMAWAFYELERHPQVLARLRIELAEVLDGRTPTAEDLPRLVYSRMVIEETLRLYPPVFITNRQAVQDDVVCGFRIPAGSLISLSPYAIQRDPRYWQNSQEFDPERFNPQMKNERPRFAYFPFGGGPRQCIGKDFALYEAVVVLAMAAQRFDWRLAPGEVVRPEVRVTYRPGIVRMVMKERA